MSDLIRREDAITAVAVAVLDDRDELEALKAIPSVQVSGDLISRQDAIEAVCRTRCGDKAKGCPAHSCLVIEEFDALPSAETHEIRTETHGVCLISKDDAIETVCRTRCGDKAKGCPAHSCLVIEEFDALPSAETSQDLAKPIKALKGSGLISRDVVLANIDERLRANGYGNVGLVSELNRLIGYVRNIPSAEATIGDYQNDLISRSALMEYCLNQKSKSIDNNDIARFPSAEAVQRGW